MEKVKLKEQMKEGCVLKDKGITYVEADNSRRTQQPSGRGKNHNFENQH